MNATRVALATYAALPALNPDDQLLLASLRTMGIASEAAVWDNPEVVWSRFDVVVVRSCWDYHLRPAAFAAWIDRVDASGARLVNPSALLRWNSDKRYLRELAVDGVNVVPTTWIEQATLGTSRPPTLSAVLEDTGWRQVVIKPVVSASAHDTWRTSLERVSVDEARFARVVESAYAGVLIQPFVPEVERTGEWSLVFLGGSYSHAALKRPATGDFRVQWEHGGASVLASAPPALVADARTMLSIAARHAGLDIRDVAYARVDGVERDGRLLLMELECLEPHLFLGYAATAPDRLAHAVMSASRDEGSRTSRQGDTV